MNGSHYTPAHVHHDGEARRHNAHTHTTTWRNLRTASHVHKHQSFLNAEKQLLGLFVSSILLLFCTKLWCPSCINTVDMFIKPINAQKQPKPNKPSRPTTKRSRRRANKNGGKVQRMLVSERTTLYGKLNPISSTQ